jgi:hypothetical protein
MNMKVLTPETPLEQCSWDETFSIFLGGSIEVDKVDKWYERVINTCGTDNIVFLNPRRNNDEVKGWVKKMEHLCGLESK